MPKTPPLLLPTGPNFQDTEDLSYFQSLLTPLPPNNSTLRTYPLETVIEENETSLMEDMMDDEKLNSTPTNDIFSQQSALSTTSASTQHLPHYYPSTGELALLPTENEWLSEDGKQSQNWNQAYDLAVTKYQHFKNLVESCSSSLMQIEEDQQDAIHDLQIYKEFLQVRGEKLRERWLQAQAHGQQFLQLPPPDYSPHH